MSIEKAKEFIDALKEKGADEAWAAKAAEAKTEEEKFALAADMAKEMGYDLTAEDVKEALAGLKKDGGGLEALDDDAVEGVTGGVEKWIESSCSRCGSIGFMYTGVSENVFWFIYRYQYRCTRCGKLEWF